MYPEHSFARRILPLFIVLEPDNTIVLAGRLTTDQAAVRVSDREMRMVRISRRSYGSGGFPARFTPDDCHWHLPGLNEMDESNCNVQTNVGVEKSAAAS